MRLAVKFIESSAFKQPETLYIQHFLSSNSEEFTKMRAFRKKMSTLSKIVFDKYEESEQSFENKAEFLSELI